VHIIHNDKEGANRWRNEWTWIIFNPLKDIAETFIFSPEIVVKVLRNVKSNKII
jgi:hypothetical protein